jgi:GNAT superfamily N-acetyltransferase
VIPPAITLRPKTEGDREFLCALYASTRTDELAQVDWPEASKQAFLRSQFEAQSAHYEIHYAAAQFDIVERDGVPIGRLYVYRGDPQDVRIVEIALIPAARGTGIGTQLLTAVMAEAARSGKTASIHVERFNPALRLYQRLGFAHVGEHGVYFLMRWSGDAQL